jgi:ATP-dependent DNA ligase
LKNQSRLLYVDQIEREGLAMFAGAMALGLEGIVAKDAASPYVEGTRVTSYWLKIKKNYERQEPIEFYPR